MPSQLEYDAMYMDIARRIAQMSKAQRRKVGALVVVDGSILSYGYNGTPHGSSNVCEEIKDGKLITNEFTIHAELNCLLKLIRHGVSIKNASMYITASPCLECSINIFQSSVITDVIYGDEYRLKNGIEFLKEKGINIRQVIG